MEQISRFVFGKVLGSRSSLEDVANYSFSPFVYFTWLSPAEVVRALVFEYRSSNFSHLPWGVFTLEALATSGNPCWW